VEPGNEKKKKKLNLWIFAFLKRIYFVVLKAKNIIFSTIYFKIEEKSCSFH
jgi:hypothetical protein